MKPISWKVVLHDALLIVVGSIIFAIGVDIFEVPYGLAAGGVTGLAMSSRPWPRPLASRCPSACRRS